MKKIALLRLLLFVLYSNITNAQLNDSLQVLLQMNHKKPISKIVWSDSGKYFVTSSLEGYIKIWDIKTGEIIHTFGAVAAWKSLGYRALCFTPDGRYLLSGDLTVNVWDVATGQFVKTLDAFSGAYINSIDIAPDSKIALIGCGNPMLCDIQSGKIIREYKLPPLENVSSVKFSMDASKFLSGWNNGAVRLYDTASEKIIKEFKLTNKRIYAVSFSNNESKILFSDEDTVYLCDKSTGNLIKSFEGHPRQDRAIVFTPDDSSLLISESKNVRKIDILTGKSTVVFTYNDGSVVAYSKDRKRALYFIEGTKNNKGLPNTRIIDLKTHNTVREFETKINKINFSSMYGVQFSPDNHMIAVVVGNQLRIIDLLSINGYRIVDSNYTGVKNSVYNGSLSFAPNGKMLAYGQNLGEKKSVSVIDPISMKKIVTFLVHDVVTSISFSADSKLMAVGVKTGKVNIIDLSTGLVNFSFKGISGFPRKLYFSKDNSLILVGSAEFIEICSIDGIHRKWNYYPRDMPVEKQKFPKVDLENWSLEARTLLKLFRTSPDVKHFEEISADGNTVFESGGIVGDDSFQGINVQSGKSIKYTGHQGKIFSLAISNNNKFVASTANDNTLRIWDNSTGKMLVCYFAIDSSDWFWITLDNYYYSSKNGSKVVSFRKNNQIYRFHQFDLQLNRPDLVMKKIGLASDSLISFYSHLVERRFRRMGVKLDSVLSNFNVPIVDVLNADSILDFTSKPFVGLDIKATSPDGDLKKINIWVNGVPLNNTPVGRNKTVSGKTFQAKYNIPLIEGKNVIEVSSSNQSERESLIESVLVNYSPPIKQKPDLYILSIGVSEYKKYPEARLKYADKDANDLVGKFSTSLLFDKVYAETLTNEIANRENILKIKKTLAKAKVNDLVILSFSGHGIVDGNRDFYFCTNNIDLDSISTTAVSFQEMSDLLDGIAPYKKMLLIDACYSGEIDKEEASLIIQKSDTSKALFISDSKLIIPGKALKFGQQGAFELMQESFLDLRRRTGTAVISSSSGVDVSYEKDKWKNGLFTFAILSALGNTKDVDLNGDGIYFSELIPYVVKTVKDLSNGVQIPTVREENIEFDYRIW